MAELRENGPYVWVTWLTKLLVGENSCEWAAWFRARHENWSWEKVPSKFDQTTWQINHTALLNQIRERLEADGKPVFVENQNSFRLRGSVGTLGGKPDIISTSDGRGVIVDGKTGKPSPSHHVQVMVYMWAVPRALRQYKGMPFDGKVVYREEEVDIPSTAINDAFVSNLTGLIHRIAASKPAPRVPSPMECGFCNITSSDCPERAAADQIVEEETKEF